MKLIVSLFLGVLYIGLPQTAHAQTNRLLITEIQTESATSAGDEFIAIANAGTDSVDLTLVKIQYFSAATTTFTSPTRTIKLTGTLTPGSTYIVASTGFTYQGAQQTFASTLAAAGGHVRLVGVVAETEIEYDRVGWGTAASPESAAASVRPKGATYKRKQAATAYVDTNNNASDFSDAVVTPQPETPVPPTQTYVQDIQITELYPDPAAPQTDAADEYIELYNNEAFAVDLTGYKLVTGLNGTYSYVFEGQTIAANSYKVFSVKETKLTLSNTAGKAVLYSPSGEVVAETADYLEAVTGQSWGIVDDMWQWGTPSPLASNNVQVEADPAVAPTASAAAKTKAKAPAKTKSASAKAVAAKTTKDPAAATTDQAYKEPAKDGQKTPVNPLILAGVGVLAVGYMLYEYRRDVANWFKRHKRNGKNSRSISA